VLPSLALGGAERALLNLLKNDTSAQHEVIVFSTKNPMAELFEKTGVVVRIFDFASMRLAPLALIRFIAYSARLQSNSRMLGWLYHGAVMTVVAKMVNPKLQVWWSLHNANLSRKVVSKKVLVAASIILFASYLVPRKIIYCSKSARRFHEKIGFFSRASEIIWNGVNSQEFYRNKRGGDCFRNMFSLREDDLIIASIARLDPQKDHETLFRAFSILSRRLGKCAQIRGRRVRLLLVGQGVDSGNQKLSVLLEKYKLANMVLPVGPFSDMNLVYNAADMVVLSSSSEALPTVLIEAGLCETHCISTLVGDVEDIINDHDLLVPPRDPEKLAMLILKLISQVDFSVARETQLSESRIRLLKLFSIDVMVSSYLTLLDGRN
jgi:glycosyltransferase involved in cell wall biosynthesis